MIWLAMSAGLLLGIVRALRPMRCEEIQGWALVSLLKEDRR